MILITEKVNENGTVNLMAEYKPLGCRLEATFYPDRRELGTWIGGGDDWKEGFESCSSVDLAHKHLTESMKQFMRIAEAAF